MASVHTRTLSILAVIAGALAGAATPAAAQTTPLDRGRYLVDRSSAAATATRPRTREGHRSTRSISRVAVSGFTVPPFDVVASNITPDREPGIGRWSDAEIKRADRRKAMRPAHGRLASTPLAPVMAVGFFKALLPEDLDAVVAYLRSVKPLRNELPAAGVPRAGERSRPIPMPRRASPRRRWPIRSSAASTW